VKFKITILRDMVWVKALNECLNLASCKYYLRCDDDHLFHPKAVEFMIDKIQKDNQNKKIVMHTTKLWEDWSGRPGGGAKLYNLNRVKKLGGFKANQFGKVDKLFKASVNSSQFSISTGGKYSLVGIHACGTWEEQKEYEKIWNSIATVSYKKNSIENSRKYKKSIEKQFLMRTDFIEKINRKSKSLFHKYIKSSK